jgi:hypothetical protein
MCVRITPHGLRLVSSSTMCTCNKWCASELQRAHCKESLYTRRTDRRPQPAHRRSHCDVWSGRQSRGMPHGHRDHTEISILYHHRLGVREATLVRLHCGLRRALRALTYARAWRAAARSSSSPRVKQLAPRHGHGRSSCPACPRRSRRSRPSRGLRRRP